MAKKLLKFSLLILFLNFTATLAGRAWWDYVGGRVEGTGEYAGKKYTLIEAVDIIEKGRSAVYTSTLIVQGQSVGVAVKVEKFPVSFSQVENDNKILDILCKGKTEQEAIDSGFVYKHDFMGTAKMYKKTDDQAGKDCKVLVETLFNQALDHYMKRLRLNPSADFIMAVGLNHMFRGLTYCKLMDIIHGDFALENVGVITKGGVNLRFVLFDFGYSVVYSEDKDKKLEDHTYIGKVNGKPYSYGILYTQPLCSLQLEARDFWHDLDAFGTLIYELMGKSPWNTNEIEKKFVDGKLDEVVADIKALRENCTHEDLKKHIQATDGSVWIDSIGETALKVKKITNDRKAAEFTTTGPPGEKYDAIRQILFDLLQSMVGKDYASLMIEPPPQSNTSTQSKAKPQQKSNDLPKSKSKPLQESNIPTQSEVKPQQQLDTSSKTQAKPSQESNAPSVTKEQETSDAAPKSKAKRPQPLIIPTQSEAKPTKMAVRTSPSQSGNVASDTVAERPSLPRSKKSAKEGLKKAQ